MSAPSFWGMTASTRLPPGYYWAGTSVPKQATGTGAAPYDGDTHVHDPQGDRTCAEYERLVDQEIADLIADLRKPCPNCGHVREEENE